MPKNFLQNFSEGDYLPFLEAEGDSPPIENMPENQILGIIPIPTTNCNI